MWPCYLNCAFRSHLNKVVSQGPINRHDTQVQKSNAMDRHLSFLIHFLLRKDLFAISGILKGHVGEQEAELGDLSIFDDFSFLIKVFTL